MSYDIGQSVKGGTVVLSPHSDDAAYSLGGAIAARKLPQPCTVITVFGNSNYAYGKFHDDKKSISQIRRVEDENWANSQGVDLIYLKNDEASLRHRSDFDAIFASNGNRQCCDMDIFNRVLREVKRLQPENIYAPIGLGNHKDHLIVRDIAIDLTLEGYSGVRFYEDLPYAAQLTKKTLNGAIGRCINFPVSTSIKLSCSQVNQKLSSIRGYGSQFDLNSFNLISEYTQLMANSERVWWEL